MLLAPFILLAQTRFEARILDIEKRFKVGRIGVGIRDLRTGKTWLYRASEPFPMQSVFKFPLGLAVLNAVDHQTLSLRHQVKVGQSELSVPMSVINERFRGQPLTYSNAELLELAVGISDNTAADLLMSQLGGPLRVTERLRKLGVTGIRIDRTERRLQLDNDGIAQFSPSLTTEDGFQKALAQVSAPSKRKAMSAYLADVRDTATPSGMVDLLTGFDRGKLLDVTSQARLVRIMTATKTGAHRLKAGLPKGTTLIHKTGTGREILGICGALNDVGIAHLPDGRRLAIAVFLAGSSGTTASREEAIADVARLAVTLK